MAKAPTRAALYGLKPAQMATKSRRLVKQARTALEALSALWDDKFQELSFDAELVIERVDELDGTILEAVAYLNEPVEGFDD